MSAGYSGTPLAKKLGIKPGSTVLTIAAPEDYLAWLAPLPENVALTQRDAKPGCDIVHVFVATRGELETLLPRARAAMKNDGAIWVSWYKKSSGIASDVTEDVIRGLALSGDLVDVNVCAVSNLWSGLKFVVRKQLR